MNKHTRTLEDVRRALDAQNRRLTAAHEAAKDRAQRVHVTADAAERIERSCTPRHRTTPPHSLASRTIPC